MIKIGLTGGIGSGKSTVAELIKDHNMPIIDADQIARDIVNPGQLALVELTDAFGPDILHPDGTLNRPKLAKLAFATPEATTTLNTITHPKIIARTAELFAQTEANGHPIAVWDMPLLIDKGYHTDMDYVIVVDTNQEERIRRLVQYRGLDEQDVRRRIAAQISDTERRQAATHIIDNNGDPTTLKPQVEAILKELTP